MAFTVMELGMSGWNCILGKEGQDQFKIESGKIT